MIPDEKAALRLHEKYGSDDRIVKHCQTVAKVALLLTTALAAKDVDVDDRAIVAGALLHDVGRTRTQTVQHGYVGAELLRSEGVDGVVLEIIRKHVCRHLEGRSTLSRISEGGLRAKDARREDRVLLRQDGQFRYRQAVRGGNQTIRPEGARREQAHEAEG